MARWKGDNGYAEHLQDLQKFGYGRVQTVEGDRLDIEFEHSGPKKVLDSFIALA